MHQNLYAILSQYTCMVNLVFVIFHPGRYEYWPSPYRLNVTNWQLGII